MPSFDPHALFDSLLSHFSSTSRLFDISIEGIQEASDDASLSSLRGQTFMVEAYCGTEALHQTSHYSLILLSTDAHIELSSLLGKVATLHTRLSDGSHTTTSGLVIAVEQIGADAGLARYLMRIADPSWMLAQSSASRAWQDTSVLDIVGSIFARYAPLLTWRVSDDVQPFLDQADQAGLRSYCVQYRETDLAFVQRILAEEGLSWRLEQGDPTHGTFKAPSLVIFADSTQADTFPEDHSSASSLGGTGIRYHQGQALEAQDSIQRLGYSQHHLPARITLACTDYKTCRTIRASVATTQPIGGPNAQATELYIPLAPYAHTDTDHAQRGATLRMQAIEARRTRWSALSTVRTLHAGSRIHITQAPELPAHLGLQDPGYPGFALTAVTHAGINNLPKTAQDQLSQHLGSIHTLLANSLRTLQDQASPLQVAPSPHTVGTNSYQNHSAQGHPASPSAQAAAHQQAQQERHLLAQAQALGYANQVEMMRADLPWRPWIHSPGAPHGSNTLGGLGQHLAHDMGRSITQLPARAALGPQPALVVGPSGSPTDTSAGDVYTDRHGRVRICYPWQGALSGIGADADGSTSGRASCWVRVAQRSAGGGNSGPGMGLQFIPRVGQEVLVQYLEGDVDRPVITGALYNGQGTGTVAPTPGGKDASNTSSNTKTVSSIPNTSNTLDSVFASALDHTPSAQANRIASGVGGISGNSPAWFGSRHGTDGAAESSAEAGGHGNAAAQWGIRTQEWGHSHGSAAGTTGGTGYNQLLFDDSAASSDSSSAPQGRIHLKTTQYGSELHLGHLIHSADNYRGSLRGQGFELRTDAYGALRAGAGLMLTTYSLNHSATSRDPAGDNRAALALLKQAQTLAQTFSGAASTHQTVTLASHVGSIKTSASAIDDKAAPLAALYKTHATQVSHSAWEDAQGDAPQKSTAPSQDALPHSADPTISLVAQGGLAHVAGQGITLAQGETTNLLSGQGRHSMTGGELRVRSGQAIGILAGATGPGENNQGISLVAAQGTVRYEAQSGPIAVQAKELVNVQSVHGPIDWAAAKSITLSVEGGASIRIADGNIEMICPGKHTVQASNKDLLGPGRMTYTLPVLPKSDNSWVKVEAYHNDSWNTAWPTDHMHISLNGELVAENASLKPVKKGT